MNSATLGDRMRRLTSWGRDDPPAQGTYDLPMQLIADEPQLRSVNAALGGAAAIAASSAATSFVSGFGCPSYDLAGYHCAFCGATRAVTALVHGDHGLALRNNLLVMLVLGLVAIRGLLLLLPRRGLVMAADAWIERVDLRVWAAALLAWTVARNLSWFWFLAPIS